MFLATPSDSLIKLHADSLFMVFSEADEGERYVHELQSLGYDARVVATNDGTSVLLRLPDQMAPRRFVKDLEL